MNQLFGRWQKLKNEISRPQPEKKLGLLAIIYRRENTIWAYFFVASLINIPMSSRHGAVLNYYLPITAAVAIICGREAGHLEKFLGRTKHPRTARLGFLSLGVLGLLSANLQQYAAPRNSDAILMRGYQWAFGKLKGDILLSQMHSLSFMTGKPIFIFPMTLETTCGPAYEGVDQSQLLADIREKRFTYVIDTCSYTFFSPRIIAALNNSYKPAVKIAIPNWRGGEEHMLWTPRGKKSLIFRGGTHNEPKNLLNILAERGMAEGAVQYYRDFLEIYPENEYFHYNLGVALGNQGKIKEALIHFAEAVRLKSDYAEAHLNWGIALYKEGKKKEAGTRFAEALRINPGYAKAHYNLGMYLSEKGKVDQAHDQMEEALRLNPDFEAARRALKSLDER